MTQRLFFTDDALTADINVISCIPHDDGFAVTVQATPFHPQGGGQPCDLGQIGDSEVLKVLQEPDSIVHYVKQAVALGPACARVDAPRRHLNARLHSAGHLIGVVGEQAGTVQIVAPAFIEVSKLFRVIVSSQTFIERERQIGRGKGWMLIEHSRKNLPYNAATTFLFA